MSKEPLYYFKLAKSMHDEYEKHSKTIGWKTQDSCQVKFKDLPLNNQKVMLHLAKFVDNKVGLATIKEVLELINGYIKDDNDIRVINLLDIIHKDIKELGDGK